MEATDPYERYARQVLLPGLGTEGQQKLAAARVLVVGAGGLGNPVIQYLAGAGVGKIGVADGDKIALSNLHRQPLFTTAEIGKSKAIIATQKITAINPLVACTAYEYPVSNQNALSLFEDYDLIVDCTDNFTARYTINDACYLLQKPLVFAAVFQYEGQLAVFNMPGNRTNYRDLFPEPPSQASVPDCNIAGVLGVLPGLLGIMQATETIKIITGIGEVLAGKLLNYDIRTHNSTVFEIAPSDRSGFYMPADRSAYEKMDYQWLCGEYEAIALDKQAFDQFLADPSALAIDVREVGETPYPAFPHLSMPMSGLDRFEDNNGYKNLIVFCQSGTRSAKAAGILQRRFGSSSNVYHLSGGLTAYYSQDHGEKS
jgi:molybdopterin/thiamine biosynthesis adenylyltransferase/rhodanese-related sulfurtransferase